ncbi:MAG: InlB B-repeat-containing protein [Bacilli bacterium]|nr:InlB B-repeat-containing protein [Bacilli bacterium]
MDSRKKKIVLAVSITAVLGMGICVMPLFGDNFAASRLRATVPNYGVVFNGTNGAASVASLKTNSANAKTGLDNNVKVDYKNVTPVSGKVGRILAKGSYGNSEPINDMTRIQVTSNAAADDAVLMWGATSGYLNHSIDLASAGDGVEVQGANFFKIVATNPVEVESISVEFGCSEKNYGSFAYDASGNPIEGAYTFEFKNGSYQVKRGSSYSNVVRAVIPDYYDDGTNGLAPVTKLEVNGSSGLFEGNSVLEEVYIPNTVTSTGNYLFYTANKMTEYTIPLNMASATSYVIPKGDFLRVLNINARDFAVSTGAISSSGQPNLEAINVSYDVESLPKIVDSWPDNVTIFYEGTEEEWGDLAAMDADQWFSFPGNVICSDSVAATVTFSFENATLGGNNGSKVINTLVGKTIADPGKPSYTGGGKKFVGWFDAPTGGNQVVFPYTVTDDATIYAQFEDLPQGSSVNDPVMVTLGQSYNHEVFAEADTAYFKVVADHDLVFTASVTSADSSFSGNIYLRGFNDDGTRITLSTGASASTDAGNSPSLTSSGGVGEILKVRLAAGDSFIVGVDGKAYSSTKYGSFSIQFTECVAGDGRDYTTAKPFTGTSFSDTVPQKGVLWASYTPETTGDYFITNECTKWCGAYIGTISNGTFTSTNVTASSGTKSVIMHLEAGTTYYVGFTANSADTVTTFTISSEIAPSYSKGSAKAVTVDGTDEVITHSSDFTDRWYTFTLDTAGKVRLTSDKKINDHTQTYSKPIFCLYDSSDAIISFGNGRTSNDKVYDLAAGTYFLKVTTNANTTFNLSPVGEEATVTVYANGPEAAATHSEIVDVGTNYLLADPTYVSGGHTYYTGFDGWYTDAEFNNQFTSGDVITANTDIYAKLTGKYQSDLFNEIDGAFGSYIQNITGGTYQFVKDGEEIISTNGGINSSSSTMAIEVKKNCTVSFDYFVSSEGSDKLYVYTRPSAGATYSSTFTASGTSMDKFINKEYLLSAGNVIEFKYEKDSSVSTGSDIAKLKNITFADVQNYNLTCVLNNGEDDIVVEVIKDQPITNLPTPTKEGKAFGGWYADPDFNQPFDASEGIAADTAIYAKWVDYAIQRGTYKGYNLYSTGSTPAAPYNYNASITVDNAGNMTGTREGKIADIENPGATYFTYSGGNCYMYYNDDAGIIWTKYSGNGNNVGTDTYIFFKDVKAVKHLRYGAAISDSSYTALLEVTRNDDSVYYVACYNNVVYDNVTWTGETAFADLTTSIAITVKDKLGNDIFTKA